VTAEPYLNRYEWLQVVLAVLLFLANFVAFVYVLFGGVVIGLPVSGLELVVSWKMSTRLTFRATEAPIGQISHGRTTALATRVRRIHTDLQRRLHSGIRYCAARRVDPHAGCHCRFNCRSAGSHQAHSRAHVHPLRRLRKASLRVGEALDTERVRRGLADIVKWYSHHADPAEPTGPPRRRTDDGRDRGHRHTTCGGCDDPRRGISCHKPL
jgi:hypothetical protein